MSSHDPRRASLLLLLEGILDLHPDGLREYDLYRILERQGVEPFVGRNLQDSLDLFRTHFLLFHLLYVLREQLHRERRGCLDIHCLKTILHPWQQATAAVPERVDPLADYYLNLDNLAMTGRQEVEGMLESFWQGYQQYEQREQACSLLGLDPQASREEIRQRYRDLAFAHHPDQGGQSETFRDIAAAAAILLRS
ncbi:MAG: DnaJ domain-containing protein [Magnetococcus sp. DMHC-1]|nr:DnaJ domain-containing protein [Magnetococcales bacterium]